MGCEEMKYEEFVAKMNTCDWKIGVGVTLGENEKVWIANVKTWKCNSFEKLLQKLREISRTWKFKVGDLTVYCKEKDQSVYDYLRDCWTGLEFDFEVCDYRTGTKLYEVPNADLNLALDNYYKRCYFDREPRGLSYIKIKQLK